METIKRLDWSRVLLVSINVPFLIVLHIAFILHVICTFWFWVLAGKSIPQSIKTNYTRLVVALFKDVEH